jgi:hypothetical protein
MLHGETKIRLLISSSPSSKNHKDYKTIE